MSSMHTVVIFGYGGHGRVIADVFEQNGISVAGFFADEVPDNKTTVDGWKILGNRHEMIKQLQDGGVSYFIGIGDNRVREQVTQAIETAVGRPPVQCISSRATVSSRSMIGNGVFIAPGAIINIAAELKDGTYVNTGATVDHDCVLEPFSCVQPGAHLAGGVRIGKRTMVGIGASVRQYLTVGDDGIIGGGAMVVKDIAPGKTVLGVPAQEKLTI